ncbi:MAG: iron hydrogenase small subunit [Azoarcus sp.]|nr:iron hydrogenase small subunit [Azoarcus sp.]MDR0564297.1 iron hydrogenase small subunit [Azoarcus sp.]
MRKSHENPQIVQIYKEFFPEGPCSHKAHELLHVAYTPRGKFMA